MKIYIAGRITGNELAYEQFQMAEEWLLKIGHAPLNPMKNLGFSYKDYIDMGLMELSKCDALFMLENEWEESDGANLEFHYANTVGMMVLREHNLIHSSLLARCTNINEIGRFLKEEKERWGL